MNEFQPEYNIKTEGHGISDEAREKLRKERLGQKFTPEHCKNISKAKKGTRLPSISKKIQCVETGEFFESITVAAEALP